MGDGPIVHALEAAKLMLRDCYWWRRLADESNPWDETTAAAHIHFDALPNSATGADHSKAELIALRPFCLLSVDQGSGFQIDIDSASGSCVLPSGRLLMEIELNTPDDLASTPTALAQFIHRRVGQILHTSDTNQPGLVQLSNQAGYLTLNTLIVDEIYRTDEKAVQDIGDAITVNVRVAWGLQL